MALHLPPGSEVDFETFEQRVQQGEWEAVVSLYQGDLFPGDRYRDWAVERREQLARLYQRALLEVAVRRLEAGDHERALEACRQILALEPWHEQAVLLGMRACVARNDRAGALRLYLDVERRLQEELGISPQEELRRFYESLR